MKEWSNKPAGLLRTGLSPVKAAGSSSIINTGSFLVSPLTGGIVVGVVSAGLYGISNLVGYAKKKKSAKQAMGDTLKRSVGLGVSAGLGMSAVNMVGGTISILGSTVIVPLAIGVAVDHITKSAWSWAFLKNSTNQKLT